MTLHIQLLDLIELEYANLSFYTLIFIMNEDPVQTLMLLASKE